MINNFHLKRYRILNDPREDEDKKFQDERKDQFIIEEKKLLKMEGQGLTCLTYQTHQVPRRQRQKLRCKIDDDE